MSEHPSHGFVIDGKEASMLFKNVREPREAESPLVKKLGNSARWPDKLDEQPPFEFLSAEPHAPKANTVGNNPGKTTMRDLEMLRGTDLAMLLKRRESSLRKATGKRTLSRTFMPPKEHVAADATQTEQAYARPKPAGSDMTHEDDGSSESV